MNKKNSAEKTAVAANTVTELYCNLDDMTAEEMGFAMEMLFEGGALEVYYENVIMKKNRPGHVLHVICENKDKDEIIKLIFKHTTTIGIRESISQRYTLKREDKKVKTKLGMVRKKTSTGYGTEKEKYEYDDLAKIAKEQGLSLFELKNKLK